MAQRMGFFMQIVRLLLFIFTVIFWLTGLALLGVGIWANLQFRHYMHLSTHDYTSATYIVMGCGAFVALVGFLGCCGAMKGNICMLRIFSVVLILLFILEVAGGITGYVYRGELKDGFKEGLGNALQDYNENGEVQTAVDDMQKFFQCCGNNGFDDWFNTEWEHSEEGGNYSVPESCCKQEKNCKHTELRVHTDNGTSYDTSDIYAKGCYHGLLDYFQSKLAVFGSTALGIAFFQLIGIGFSCCLISALKRQDKYELV